MMSLKDKYDDINGLLFDKLEKELHIFPLQTIQSMAERWGVTKNVVSNWSRRHDDFPKPLEGIVEQTAGSAKIYPLYEVERYERMRGLVK